MFTVDQLRHFDSMTKYPQIDTYHQINPQTGELLDTVQDFSGGNVIATEKVNGCNARIIIFPDGDWLIGSRKELLHALGDRVANPELGIVEAIRDIAVHLADFAPYLQPTVFFGEVYGSGIEGGKAYTRTKGLTGFQLFDMATVNNWEAMLDWPIEKVASWRQHGGQDFLPEDLLIKFADRYDLELAPRLFEITPDELPTDIDKTRAWLAEHLPATLVALDGEPGKSEGIVLRSFDRRVIAKARFEDYDRTIRKRAQGSR